MLLEFLPLHCSINKGKVACLGSFYATSLCFSSFFLSFPLPLPSPDRLFIRILDLSQYRSCSTFAFKENPPLLNPLLRLARPRSARAAPLTLAFLCEYVRSGAKHNLWNVRIPTPKQAPFVPLTRTYDSLSFHRRWNESEQIPTPASPNKGIHVLPTVHVFLNKVPWLWFALCKLLLKL